MKDSIKAKSEKFNAEAGSDLNDPESTQMKDSSKNKESDNDALHAIAEYINKSNC